MLKYPDCHSCSGVPILIGLLDRLRLLVHILCELRDSHGVTADKLREAGQDVRRQITPANRLQVLDEIYFVRETEERFLDGEIGMFVPETWELKTGVLTREIDANTLVQVTHTQVPEATYPEDELSNVYTAPILTVPSEHDEHEADDDQVHLLTEGDPLLAQGSHGVPLSPATSVSSGSHSPTTGFNTYRFGMSASGMPQESPGLSATKAVAPDPHYMLGYYSQPFVPTDKPSSYWPDVTPMASVSQYRY